MPCVVLCLLSQLSSVPQGLTLKNKDTHTPGDTYNNRDIYFSPSPSPTSTLLWKTKTHTHRYTGGGGVRIAEHFDYLFWLFNLHMSCAAYTYNKGHTHIHIHRGIYNVCPLLYVYAFLLSFCSMILYLSHHLISQMSHKKHSCVSCVHYCMSHFMSDLHSLTL